MKHKISKILMSATILAITFNQFVFAEDTAKKTEVSTSILPSEWGIWDILNYIPINKQPFYKNLGYGDEKTPIMNKYYDECFSLPMYPSLSEDEQEYVIKNLLEFLFIRARTVSMFLKYPKTNSIAR
jgi:dTDP-4-amino-4,6-dideoxygalactose transaminase